MTTLKALRIAQRAFFLSWVCEKCGNEVIDCQHPLDSRCFFYHCCCCAAGLRLVPMSFREPNKGTWCSCINRDSQYFLWKTDAACSMAGFRDAQRASKSCTPHFPSLRCPYDKYYLATFFVLPDAWMSSNSLLTTKKHNISKPMQATTTYCSRSFKNW